MTPRELEDLVVPCPQCGAFVTGMIGARDWLSRHRPYERDRWHELDDELSSLIENPLRRLWDRVKRSTGRTHDDDDDEAEAEDAVTVTRDRIGDADDTPLTCDASQCGADLPVTWSQIAAAHDRLTADELAWLERYTRAKSLLRLGLFRPGIGFHTELGTFSTTASPPLDSPYGTIAEAGAPVFVVSGAIASKTGSLTPPSILSQLAGDERCTTGPDTDALDLPIYFEPPRKTVKLQLGLDVDAIAHELARGRATPLRGIGTLRLLPEVDWVSVTGKLVIFEFAEPLREAIMEAVRGEC